MTSTITLLSAGMQTLIVDGGRPRSRSLGVPLGGAADRFSLAIGNALVGNAPDCAALEVCLVGPTLVADTAIDCVLYGAPFALHTNRRRLHSNTTFHLEAGEELYIGGTARGMRAYLCIRGGVIEPVVLGSRSSLAPLRTGMRLGCSAVSATALESGEVRWVSRRVEVECDLSPVLRVLPGGQAEWFGDQRLTSAEVTPASNRMGLRLLGAPFRLPPREMVSEPVCPGTVQVTRDGQCIVLGVDGQTIGGYPKIGQVITADLDRLGQLRPGTQVRFEYVSLDEAEGLARGRRAKEREWQTRVSVSRGETPHRTTAL